MWHAALMTATPRQRARIAAVRDIKRIARRQLAHGGAAALSLREIAKEMGLVSSAIYRYVPSRHELLTALIADAYDRLGTAAESADATLDPADLASRWRALTGALRDWALADPTDYTLVYGPPIQGYDAPLETYAPAQRWIEVLIDILARADHAAIEPVGQQFLDQLARVRDQRSPNASLGGVADGLAAWSQLHGLVSLEIYGQTAFVLGDGTGLFQHCVERQIRDLRLTDPP